MVVLDDMISNKKKLANSNIIIYHKQEIDISLVLFHNLFFLLQKDKLNTSHYFIMKIINKPNLQQIGINRSSNNDFKDFMKLYNRCTSNDCLLVHDTILTSDNPFQSFRKSIMTTDEKTFVKKHYLLIKIKR